MFSLELLQAINDWQKSSSDKRGEKLKSLAAELPDKFRTSGLCCFRQIALDKRSLWDLLAEGKLPEKISSWTIDVGVAKCFKGGVPPQGQGWQGVIFVLRPKPEHVILNLPSLYKDTAFQGAIQVNKSKIVGFSDGIGRYENDQSEVIIELSDLSVPDVYALGGFSGNQDELAELFFNKKPTQEERMYFDKALSESGEKLGARWLEGEGVANVVERMQPYIESLRKIKAIQSASKHDK